jgi:hypothetical protein
VSHDVRNAAEVEKLTDQNKSYPSIGTTIFILEKIHHYQAAAVVGF